MPDLQPPHASHSSSHPTYLDRSKDASNSNTSHDTQPTVTPALQPATERTQTGGGIQENNSSAENNSPATTTTTAAAATEPTCPNPLISPTSTPPETSGIGLNSIDAQSGRLPGVQHTDAPPTLLSQLPNVECIVRARIPTTNGAEMFLHLYRNDIDNKEHLAIVFGNSIRSRSLDRVRPGETEMDRMIRGAYVGTLHPGRLSSWYDEEKSEPAKQRKQENIQGDGGEGRRGGGGESSVSGATQSKEERGQGPLVRIHSECYTGETAWSARCDCGEQLEEAARIMSFPHEVHEDNLLPDDATPLDSNSNFPGGVIIYLRQEGRGIGLGEKLKAYNLQDLGSDTVEANLLLRHPADARSYGLATAMLVDLGLGVDSNPHGIRLLTNNPEKIRAIEGPNCEVAVNGRVSMVPLAWKTGGKRGVRSSEVEGYLQTKIAKMGHMIQ